MAGLIRQASGALGRSGCIGVHKVTIAREHPHAGAAIGSTDHGGPVLGAPLTEEMIEMAPVKRLVVAAVFTAAAITAPALPAASAAPCPDIEVIYARSTGGVGLGDVGQAFVDAVRARAGGRSVDAYSVNYPASFDFANSVPIGAADAALRRRCCSGVGGECAGGGSTSTTVTAV